MDSHENGRCHVQLPEEQQQLLAHAASVKKRRITTDTDDESFLQPMSDHCCQDCLSKFIDATGNKVTLISVYAVCAGTFHSEETCAITVSDLQKKNKLSPMNPHPAHILTDGMLLHRDHGSIHTDDHGNSLANVCDPCSSALLRNQTPQLSLANDMWIGDIPLELQILTLSECILVTCYFPAVYIIKLYPKKKDACTWASANLHSGLWGNVSTYCLNTDDIVKMTCDQVMPPSVSILTATIGVTFVGPKNLPEKTMPGFLQVNRTHMCVALQWLKKNNPIYHHIIISPSRLNELPINGIPHEITSLARHLEDIILLAKETGGYVPEECIGDEGKCNLIYPIPTNSCPTL